MQAFKFLVLFFFALILVHAQEKVDPEENLLQDDVEAIEEIFDEAPDARELHKKNKRQQDVGKKNYPMPRYTPSKSYQPTKGKALPTKGKVQPPTKGKFAPPTKGKAYQVYRPVQTSKKGYTPPTKQIYRPQEKKEYRPQPVYRAPVQEKKGNNYGGYEGAYGAYGGGY